MKDALSLVRFDPGDVLLFDEPETAQDIESIVKLRQLIDGLCEKETQIIVASHHPIFWSNAHVIELAEGYVEKIVSVLREYL